MHSLVWVTSRGGDNNHQLITVTQLCSLHRGSSFPQRCFWSRSIPSKPLLLLLPRRKLACSNPTVIAELWEDQNRVVLTSRTFGHLLPSPPALSILQLGGQAGTPRLNPDPPRGFPHLGMDQEGSQQLIPTSQLQFFSTTFVFPAQRWHLPPRSSMGRFCLILDFLQCNWICIPG